MKRTLGFAVLSWLAICSAAYVWGYRSFSTTLIGEILLDILSPGLLVRGLVTGQHREFEDWRDPTLLVVASSTFWALVTLFGRHLWRRYVRTPGRDAA